jgi:hypothetical protein
MKSPKQALIDDGFPGVKAGKGRLSADAIARCKELAASGVRIKGYELVTAPEGATNPEPTVKKVKPQASDAIADLPPMRYDEGKFKAVSDVPIYGRTVHGMREVCQCRSSLSYHVCNSPTVLGVPVRIVPM